MVNKAIIICLAVSAFCACDRLDFKGSFVPTSDLVETRFEESLKITGDKAIALVNAPDQYIFYVCTDPHIYDTSVNIDEFNRALRNDKDASFGVNLGDCVDTKDNFLRFKESVEFSPEQHKYNYPIFHVLGNHDLFFDGWSGYRTHIGPSVYWFEVKTSSATDLFLCLDSATGTFGRKQTKWLKSFLSDNRGMYRHCMVLTHTNFFNTDNSQNTSGNYAMEEMYSVLDLFSKHNVTLVLQGHDHHREDLTFGGVRYTVVGTIRDEFEEPEYLKVTVSQNELEYSWVEMK